MSERRVKRERNRRKLSSLIRVLPGPLPTPCWVWIGKLHLTRGYGNMRRLGRTWDMHVYTYTCLHGEIPAGMVLDHLCRNRKCCNPAHLEVVTAAENCRRGDNAKLDWGKVRDIRSRAAAGEKQRSIAAAYGMTEAAVSLIVSGKRWAENDKPGNSLER